MTGNWLTPSRSIFWRAALLSGIQVISAKIKSEDQKPGIIQNNGNAQNPD